jgi:hypothetical protein
MPVVKVDLLIEAIEEFAVPPGAEPEGAIACLLEVRFVGGQRATIGLSRPALEALCNVLIDNSPRTPGTPGRN